MVWSCIARSNTPSRSYNPSGDSTTWNSQSTYIYPFKHADGHLTYLYMGDRWNEVSAMAARRRARLHVHGAVRAHFQTQAGIVSTPHHAPRPSRQAGPGSLENATAVWLPLIPPTNAPPANGSIGFILTLATCNATDPAQLFTLTAANTLVHASSALCVNAGGAGGDDSAVLATCVSGAAAQRWTTNGNRITNGQTGNGCIDLNNSNELVSGRRGAQCWSSVEMWRRRRGKAPAF